MHVRVAAGDPLDEVVLRSYAIGAAHMALGWVLTEGLAVDPETGEVHDLTIRSFGILRAKDTPPIDVEIVDDSGRAACAVVRRGVRRGRGRDVERDQRRRRRATRGVPRPRHRAPRRATPLTARRDVPRSGARYIITLTMSIQSENPMKPTKPKTKNTSRVDAMVPPPTSSTSAISAPNQPSAFGSTPVCDDHGRERADEHRQPEHAGGTEVVEQQVEEPGPARADARHADDGDGAQQHAAGVEERGGHGRTERGADGEPDRATLGPAQQPPHRAEPAEQHDRRRARRRSRPSGARRSCR